MAEVTPVTLVTGFLGAGKTTLLNQMLRQPGFARTVVLLNEFGEVGLDHLLVGKLDADAVMLNAGCLCCTVRDDLTRILRQLLPRARRDEVDRIVIETTGLADPVPILETLLHDPVAASAYRMESVVTVVDAVHGAAQLDAQPEAVRQVAVADHIILSKTDLGDPAALRVRLRRLNPGARVVDAALGRPGFEPAIDAALLLRSGMFGIAAKIPAVAEWFADETHDGTHVHDHGRDANRHDARIETFCLTSCRQLVWEDVRLAMRSLATTYGEKLLRVKGILNLKDYERPMAIHGVRHMLHPPMPLPAWPDGDPRTSRLVFITCDLSREVVEATFHDSFNVAAQ